MNWHLFSSDHIERNMRLRLLCSLRVISLLLALPISESFTEAQTSTVCESNECMAAAKILQDSIDTKVNPCDDFYQYACGNWPTNHENISKIPINIFTALDTLGVRRLQQEEEIKDFLQQNNSPDEPTSLHKVRELYSVCSNTNPINGYLNVRFTYLGRFSPYKDPNLNFDYFYSLIKAFEMFDIYVDVHPRNRSLNSIWQSRPVSQDKATVIKNASLKDERYFVEKFIEESSLPSAGENLNLKIDVLKQIRDRTDEMEKANTKTSSENTTATIYTLEELQIITDYIHNKLNSSVPKLNWTRYIEEVFDGSKNVTLDLQNASNVQIVTSEMNFIQDLFEFIYSRNISQLENHLRLSTRKYLASVDPSDSPPDIKNYTYEEWCRRLMIREFDFELSFMYLKQKKINDAKIEIDKMVNNIKISYEKLFEQTSWMDRKTKTKALMKLASMKSLIAYPSLEELYCITNKTNLQWNITRSSSGTVIEVAFYKHTPQNWHQAPIIVNAFYSQENNSIIIPAAILGPPLYFNSLKALIYGMTGFMVGHELSHGFHIAGATYIPKGKIENWWANATKLKYEKKANCFREAYNNYNFTFQGFHQKHNSTTTLNEDLADNAGFKAALHAYRRYVSEKGPEPLLKNFENYTSEQLFTLGFANLWCEYPEKSRMNHPAFLNDSHSPNGVRVNGVFINSYEFSSIWNCPKGTNMNPCEDKCILF